MPLLIANLRVRSLDVDSKEITWMLGDGLSDGLDYTFQVLRSESPSGPFDPITEPFEERYIFVDRRIPSTSKFALLHYKLRTRKKTTDELIDFGPAAQTPEPDISAQAIRRLELIYFTQVVGRACWLFKKRSFGPRCRACWDSVLHKRVVDRCADCFGTGMLRGYHSPIEIWVQIDPPTKARQNQGQQIAEFVQSTARTSFFPNIDPGDVLVEAENKRWRVQSVTTSERLRAPIKQELTLRMIEEKDMEFKLPINLAYALRDIQPSPARLYEHNADLEGALANQTSDAFAGFMTYPPYDEEDLP